MRRFYLVAGLMALCLSVCAQQTATFDDFSLQPDSWWNGSDGSGGFTSGDFWFPNDYNADWQSWSGFSVSNMKDSTTAGIENQYSSAAGIGADSSENYAVAYLFGELKVELKNPAELSGFYVTNSAYACLSMRYGDTYSKKFGGQDGTDPDYFKLIVSGTDIYGNDTEDVEFFLADFRSENSDSDYIVNTWEWVDLGSLGVVTEISFSLESTDIGNWGMNTPAYFCVDNFNGSSSDLPEVIAEATIEDIALIQESYYNGADGAGAFTSGGFIFKNSYNPDWGSWSGFAASNTTDTVTAGWTNQYSAITGQGALGTSNYAVGYPFGHSEIEFEETVVSGFYITNSTYAYRSILLGDEVAKRFGGADGTDPDWFRLTITGISSAGDTTGTVEYYLADYRFESNEEDYIINDWQWIGLDSLGAISKLRFNLSSNDNGQWGMNTPGYFCIDQINHQDSPPIISNPLADIKEDNNNEDEIVISLDSVFTDPDNPDSSIVFAIENIDNPDLISGIIDQGGEHGSYAKTVLVLNQAPDSTGVAEVIISATSNGKSVYYRFNVEVDIPVSSEMMTISQLKVYPNPVKSHFFVELPDEAGEMVLMNISGQVIIRKYINSGSVMRISDLSGQPAGIYFLKVKSESGYFTSKIIKN